MDVQYKGPLSWRMVGEERSCRMMLKNNSAATITKLKIHDVRFDTGIMEYPAATIEFETIPILAPVTELLLNHCTWLTDYWEPDTLWQGLPGSGRDELIRFSEEYWRKRQEDAKVWKQEHLYRWKEDVLAEFFVDGKPSSQHLKVGTESGLRIERQ